VARRLCSPVGKIAGRQKRVFVASFRMPQGGVKGMDFLRQPVRPVHIVVVLVVLVAIIAGVWAWRQRTTRQQAEQAQQEVLQQMKREGTQY